MVVDGQQRVHRAGHGDQRALDAARRGERRHLRAQVGGRQPRDVVVGTGARAVGVVRRIEPLLPLALRHFPELRPVAGPKGSLGAGDDVWRVAGGADVLRGGAVGVEAGGRVVVVVEDRGRQVGEQVGRVLVDEGAFPVDAAVEQLGRGLDGAAHLVAAVGRAHGVDEARRAAVVGDHALAREARGLDHGFGPARELLVGAVVVEVHEGGRHRVQPAAQRVGRRGQLQVEHALVLRRIGIALLHHIVAPREVAVELAARARGAGHHEAAVPVLRQAQQEARLASGIGRDAAIQLDARHDLGDGRALGGARRDRRSIGLRRERERRQAGDGVVGRRGVGVGGGEVGAVHAGGVGEGRAELPQQPIAGRGGAGGQRNETGERQQGRPTAKQGRHRQVSMGFLSGPRRLLPRRQRRNPVSRWDVIPPK